jgi:hypothetical protein
MKNAARFTLSRTANVSLEQIKCNTKKENLKSEGFTEVMWKEVTLLVKKKPLSFRRKYGGFQSNSCSCAGHESKWGTPGFKGLI